MNRRMISYILGMLLLLEGALMLLPTVVAMIYGESRPLYSFAATIVSLVIIGTILMQFKPKTKAIYSRDGFIIVSFGWILISLFGAIPFSLSGEIPNYLDAVFESVSGFTTTGASILTDVEVLSKSILFWRSFTHWIGGMGILVFVMAVIPLAGGGGNMFLMKAESPGPDVGKLVPKAKSTAKILYEIYFALTVIEAVLLLCGGEDIFTSITLSFGTAGTGGFGINNTSIAGYSTYTQIVIGVFMALFGVNFNLYFLILCGKVKAVFKSEEFRAYIIIMAGAILMIFLNIRHMFDSIGSALHASAFQVASVMTTTGYTTVDFDKWPEFARIMMLLVMCIGACAGSTGGGIKVARILILFKNIKKELRHLSHPRSVNIVRLNNKTVDADVLHGTNVYFVIYVIIFVLSLILVSLDKVDFTTNVTAIIATLNNIGPGLGKVGATGNYAFFSWHSKIVMIFDMFFGRLEIFPLLMLFSPIFSGKQHFQQKVSILSSKIKKTDETE